MSVRCLQDFSDHHGAAKSGKSARRMYECCQYRVRALRDIFYDVCAALLQCLHDVRIILRFAYNQLPKDVRNIRTEKAFKNAVKMILLSNY